MSQAPKPDPASVPMDVKDAIELLCNDCCDWSEAVHKNRPSQDNKCHTFFHSKAALVASIAAALEQARKEGCK